MGQNGLCLPFLRGSVYHPKAKVHNRTTVKEHHLALSPLIIVIMLTCQPYLADTSSPLCPEQCFCSNATTVTTAFGMEPVFVIDCSNGSLQGFIAHLSKDGLIHANDTKSISPLHYDASNNGSTNIADNLQEHSLSHPLSNSTQRMFYDNLEYKGHGRITMGDHLPNMNLDLTFNKISSTSDLGLLGWKSAPNVIKLNLSNNVIETLNGSFFHPYTNLVTLDLSNNIIDAFTPIVFHHLPSLKYLYLYNNRIANIELQQPGDLPFISNIIHLDLSQNRLLSLPAGAFSPFPMLTSLNLTHNPIIVISQSAFMGLPQLRSLSLSQSNISNIDYPVFQNTSLRMLWLDNMPHLSHLSHNVFEGLAHLQYLNLSHNYQLSFLHHDILSGLQSLQILDLSGNNIQKLSSLTFRHNLQLHSVYLNDIPFSCDCTNAWLVEHSLKNNSFLINPPSLECVGIKDNQTLPTADAYFPCSNLSIPGLQRTLSVAIGSTLTLQCRQIFTSGEDILIWTTPRGNKYYYHHFHPNASQHLLSFNDVQPRALFHKDHFWHQSSSYNSDLDSYKERILVLSDGSLFIDYVLRTDAGSYSCVVKNAYANVSGTIIVQFSYNISGEIKIIACLVGILCALGFFTLNVIYVVISWLARRLINKRRREHIRQMLENLNSYKSTQITRIYENYTGQLTRVRNRYHVQRDRLHKNYTMQVERVKRGCSHQVEKVRDNYNNRLLKLREYSSSQVQQIREMATNQIGRIRDYGSLQLDRLRETYKLQHQHMMKLLDTMNLDNCRSIVETECMRTESLMYDLDLLSQEDVRIDSPFSIADVDSEYNTATSSPMLSVGSQELIDVSSHQIKSNETGHQYEMVGENDVYFSVGDRVTDHEEVLRVSKSRKRNSMVDDNDYETGDDINIEMNTVLRLPDNVQLDAKEVWTYGKGDESTHTLYTKILRPKQTNTECEEDSAHQINDLPEEQASVKVEMCKTMTGVSLPSIELATAQSPEWDGSYMEHEASPVKVWQGPPPLFHCDDYKDYTTVHLYDGDVEEEDDDDEEKTERDTMV